MSGHVKCLTGDGNPAIGVIVRDGTTVPVCQPCYRAACVEAADKYQAARIEAASG